MRRLGSLDLLPRNWFIFYDHVRAAYDALNYITLNYVSFGMRRIALFRCNMQMEKYY